MRISDWSSDVCSSDLRRALPARRAVAAVGVDARIAEAHRHDGDAALVVERLAPDLQPVAQAVARAVVPGNAGLVHAGAGCLADDQQFRAGRSAHHGARSQRQLRRAEPAGARFRDDPPEARNGGVWGNEWLGPEKYGR